MCSAQRGTRLGMVLLMVIVVVVVVGVVAVVLVLMLVINTSSACPAWSLSWYKLSTKNNHSSPKISYYTAGTIM